MPDKADGVISHWLFAMIILRDAWGLQCAPREDCLLPGWMDGL